MKSKKNKKNLKGGSSCSVKPSASVPDCIKEFNANYYKTPCKHLPLDGQVGGKKKSLKKKSKKKGGFLNDIIIQANKLAVPLSLVAIRKLLKKSKSMKKK